MGTSVSEQYIVDEKGNPTAVILPIDGYKKILAILRKNVIIYSPPLSFRTNVKNLDRTAHNFKPKDFSLWSK